MADIIYKLRGLDIPDTVRWLAYWIGYVHARMDMAEDKVAGLHRGHLHWYRQALRELYWLAHEQSRKMPWEGRE